MTHAHSGNRLILSGCIIINDHHEVLLLYRPDHNHFETPGGKVRLDECSNPASPSIMDLMKTAKRELVEELGDNLTITSCSYFGKVEFTIPDGRLAIANKFLVQISGQPRINEPERFTKLEYIAISDLANRPISPDLRLFLQKLQER